MFRFVVLPCFDLCRSNSSHEETTKNRPVHVKHEMIHYCRIECDVTVGIHSSAILAGICIAFYGSVVQL